MFKNSFVVIIETAVLIADLVFNELSKFYFELI